jgi:hypothetical protein
MNKMSCCVNNHTDDYIKIIVQNPITYTFCLFPFVFLSLHWFPLVSMTFLSISHFPFQFPPPHARAQTTERWRGLAPPDRLFPFLLLSALSTPPAKAASHQPRRPRKTLVVACYALYNSCALRCFPYVLIILWCTSSLHPFSLLWQCSPFCEFVLIFWLWCCIGWWY